MLLEELFTGVGKEVEGPTAGRSEGVEERVFVEGRVALAFEGVLVPIICGCGGCGG